MKFVEKLKKNEIILTFKFKFNNLPRLIFFCKETFIITANLLQKISNYVILREFSFLWKTMDCRVYYSYQEFLREETATKRYMAMGTGSIRWC